MTLTLILTANPNLLSRLLISPFREQANALQAVTGLEMDLEALLVVEVPTQQAMIKVRFHRYKKKNFPCPRTLYTDLTCTAFRDRGPSYENRNNPPDGGAHQRGMITPDTQSKQSQAD